MKLNRQEKEIVRRKFCAYCIKVLHGEALNYLDELERQRKREVNFSELLQKDLDALYCCDDYDIADYFCKTAADRGTLGKIHLLVSTQRTNQYPARFLEEGDYKERMKNFKAQFELAKEQFDRNIQVETLRMLAELCKSRCYFIHPTSDGSPRSGKESS